ncbi:arylamine N-acetyltransferase family protein [Alloiococcus sp. CFN-8]|uniref:arylamine N-acetyltransferase family protein n=1 Tax=Alloiococcus sp. CFN-8 TaxID=3416081 RepID=UPI003CEDC506
MKYSYKNLSNDQIERYLERINYRNKVEVNEKCLSGLVDAHQKAIIFENLDIYFEKRPVSLELDDLFDKLVTRKRGGFCFELNGLFVALLRSIGFDAWSCFCRVTMFEGEYFMPINHRGCIVKLDNLLYYCDVGFGGPMPGGALPIGEDGEHTIKDETYFTIDCGDGWKEMWRKSKVLKPDEAASEWVGKRILRFSLNHTDPIDFIALCNYMARDESEFRTGYMVNYKREDGYYAISGRTLHINTSSQEFKKELETEDDARIALKKYFGISIKV